MAHGLSTLARLVHAGAFEEFEEGLEGPRTSPLTTAKPGFTRGSLGSTGVRSPGAPQSRNPDAKIDKERQQIQSPIMQAFLSRQNGAR